MKKILSIVLAISMIATILVVGITVNAAETGKVDATYTPEGTAITSAAEFATMTADGKYYLANDITVDASYANSFTGTFDGNGKTITATAPLFASLAGTVKNVTVNATIAETTENNAIIAVQGSGNIKFENVHTTGTVAGGAKVAAFVAYGADGTNVTLKNCVNDASLTGSGHVAGFVANIDGVTTFLAENCANNGALTSTGSYAAGIATILGKDGLSADKAKTVSVTVRNCTNTGNIKGYTKNSGGIIGYSLGVITIENCVNRGNVENETENAAGILGSSAYQENKAAATIIGCENYGEIKAAKKAGGIAAYFARTTPITDMTHSIENCANYGDIYLYASGTQVDGCQAAGIAARSYAAKVCNSYVIKNCINVGNITVDMTNGPSKTNAAGIIAYTNQTKHIFENNINLGNITVNNGATNYEASTFILRATAPDLTYVKNNYGIAIENTDLLGGDSLTITDDIAKAVTAEQVASGELVYALNTAAGKTVFYQDLANNGLPTLKANDAHIVNKTGDVYHNGEAPTTPPEADVTTTLPTEDVTTTAPTPEDTTTANTPADTTTVPADNDTTTLPDLDDPTTPTDETTAPADDTTTVADNTTATPDTTTAEAPAEKSCGGFALAAQLVAVLGAALTVVVIKKK